MTNWRENGFVPDSDDDNDDTDKNNTQSPQDHEGLPRTPNYQRGHQFSTLHSSPYSKTFKVPKPFWEDIEEDSGHRSRSINVKTPREDLSMFDEVSKSYVQISTPASSVISSPPNTLPNIFEYEKSKSPVTLSQLSGNNLGKKENSAVQIREHETHEESSYPKKRVLRRRNLIQLHPYVVEQEKYRQTLRSRGIVPVRIALSQDNRNHRSRPSISTSYQTLDDKSLQLRKSPMSVYYDQDRKSTALLCPVETVDYFDHSNHSLDSNFTRKHISQDSENFPDINRLIKRKNSLIPVNETINEIDNFHMKFRQSPYHDTGSLSPPFQVSPSSRNFDSQSPFNLVSLASSRSRLHDKPSFPYTLSISSPDSNPSLLVDDEPELSTKAEFLTQTTQPSSSLKPLKIGMKPNFNFDRDDPFVSDPVEYSSTLSSSEDSMIIRRVRKKIRGVLPASHLRLDAERKPSIFSRTSRDIMNSLTSKEIKHRKGIAIPKSRENVQNFNNVFSGLQFLADNSDNENTEDECTSISIKRKRKSIEDVKYYPECNKLGFAKESNAFDEMLPYREKSKFEKKVGEESNFDGVERQTKITYHSKRPCEWDKKSTSIAKKIKPNTSYRIHNVADHGPQTPPLLSILDVLDSTCELPTFIKIAARTARSKKNLGRHSPSRKFIRLSTVEDTRDARGVLMDWRKGKIICKSGIKQLLPARQKINQSCGMCKSQERCKNLSTNFPGQNMSMPKYTVKNLKIQQFIDDFIPRKQVSPANNLNSRFQDSRRLRLVKKKKSQSKFLIRPAQLESSQITKYITNPSDVFKFSKNKLDDLYAGSLRQPFEKSNIQLNRFLGDEESFHTTIKKTSVNQKLKSTDKPHQTSSARTRPRKRLPKRVDAGAERYRQPSDPLILDTFTLEKGDITKNDCKLFGLGKLGTKYPTHFGIFPLRSGIFFHKSTFIGSGGVKDVIEVGDKIFSWSTWNETSSSEIGVCFDLLSDYLLDPQMNTSSTLEAKHITLFILSYALQNISFNGSLNELSFISRMVQILQEFSIRMDLSINRAVVELEQRTIVLSLCSVLVFHLLQIARSKYQSLSHKFKLEELLIKITSECTTALLLEGLESIRKTYDDLQYCSYREAGICSERYTTEAWVIIMRILNAARIPQGSFWNIVNPQLRLNEISTICDAASLEKIWYSMYSLLPLCEFDDLGQILPDRQQVVSFDNWSLPQYLLKRVLDLYTTNPRQSSGFIVYCKTLLIRCHHLIIEWRWSKCSTFIGYIFDFFASQNFSHLRNEEVYHSPSFLEKLDTDPSLDIEEEDCCFHIFLKIIALEFKYFTQVGDTKSIRNLGTRLLPNHARQYLKEEDVHQQDLASLRNHHDLLCTLFWSMPPDQRPSASFIEDLVIADRSHREACMINLRSWENLTRFLVTSTVDTKLYQPFKTWQSSFFKNVYDQFLAADKEIRQQAQEIYQKTGNLMTEQRICDYVFVNKRNLITIMCRSLKAMQNSIRLVKSDSMMKQAMNCDVLSKALDPYLHNEEQLSDSLLIEIIQVLMYSIDKTENLYSSTLNENFYSNCEKDDSQDSIDINNWSYLEMISLLENLLNRLRPVIKLRFNELSTKVHENSINVRLIDCWGRLIFTVTRNEIKSNLILDSNTVFNNRRSRGSANYYWPLFIAKLLHHGKSFDEFKLSGIDIGLEWLVSLTDIEIASMPRVTLTFQLYQKGHFLCKTSYPEKFDRVKIICATIRRMSYLIFENLTEVEIGLTQKQAQRYFSNILGEVLNSIQQVLKSLDPSSDSHRTYLNFARSVVTNIRCYASDFRPLTEFFIHPSAHYWPHDADPNLYAAGIISYSVRLSQRTEKTSFELFYYLHSGWKNALITDCLEEYTRYIIKGLRCKKFTRFMLMDFVPAIFEVGFRTDGWLICSTFLPALSYRFRRLLEMIEPDSSWALKYFLNILKIIINGTNKLVQQFPNDIRGAHPDHRGILVVAFQFWMQNAFVMHQYIERHPQVAESIREIIDPLSSFIYNAIKCFEKDHNYQYLPSKNFHIFIGKFYKKFVDFFARDIHEYWQFMDETHFSVIVRARSGDLSGERRYDCTLKEMLQSEIVYYENLFEYHDGKELTKKPDFLIQQLIL